MSEKPLDLDSVQHQIDAVQIEMWLPLPVVRVLELTPAMLQEIKDLRQQLTERNQEMSDTPDMAGGDEYHTLEELYEYRMLYNAHAAQGWLSAGIPVTKSWHHSDGEECFGGGWFIVTAQLPTGQVSNHYPAKDWELFDVPWVDVAPEWDGHTPQQAADRLRNHLKGTRK